MPFLHSYCDYVKNITLSVEDTVYDAARVTAALRKTSVSGLVRDYLNRLSSQEENREQARQQILKMIGSFDGKVGFMPKREERNGRR
jgi:hypothetical protein